jgi:heme oxygenase (mycobilin-producing)
MMLYITYGTVDYLAKLVKAHNDKRLRLMANNDTAVLFHETDGASIFNVPKRYEVLESTGNLLHGKFAVVNNIPVSYEGRPLYEKRFSDRARLLEKQRGITAIRVLRPEKSDTYIILTLWESEQFFKAWQDSLAGIEQQHTFPRPSYITTYSSIDIED